MHKRLAEQAYGDIRIREQAPQSRVTTSPEIQDLQGRPEIQSYSWDLQLVATTSAATATMAVVAAAAAAAAVVVMGSGLGGKGGGVNIMFCDCSEPLN